MRALEWTHGGIQQRMDARAMQVSARIRATVSISTVATIGRGRPSCRDSYVYDVPTARCLRSAGPALLYCERSGGTAFIHDRHAPRHRNAHPARPERMGPSTLIEAGGQRLLFDVGRATTIRLAQARIPHTERDHCLSHAPALRSHRRPSGFVATGWLPFPRRPRQADPAP